MAQADRFQRREKMHYCPLCMCWIANNSFNIKMHEESERHKKSLKGKIEIMRKSDAEEQEISKEITRMRKEAAAASASDSLQIYQQSSGGIAALRPNLVLAPSLPYSGDKSERGDLKIKENPKLKALQEAVKKKFALPENWTAHTDPTSGGVFYHNIVTNQTQWERPLLSDEERHILEEEEEKIAVEEERRLRLEKEAELNQQIKDLKRKEGGLFNSVMRDEEKREDDTEDATPKMSGKQYRKMQEEVRLKNTEERRKRAEEAEEERVKEDKRKKEEDAHTSAFAVLLPAFTLALSGEKPTSAFSVISSPFSCSSTSSSSSDASPSSKLSLSMSAPMSTPAPSLTSALAPAPIPVSEPKPKLKLKNDVSVGLGGWSVSSTPSCLKQRSKELEQEDETKRMKGNRKIPLNPNSENLSAREENVLQKQKMLADNEERALRGNSRAESRAMMQLPSSLLKAGLGLGEDEDRARREEERVRKQGQREKKEKERQAREAAFEKARLGVMLKEEEEEEGDENAAVGGDGTCNIEKKRKRLRETEQREEDKGDEGRSRDVKGGGGMKRMKMEEAGVLFVLTDNKAHAGQGVIALQRKKPELISFQINLKKEKKRK